MANFKEWIKEGTRRGDALRNDSLDLSSDDTGNYNSLGQLVGTKYSISAPYYEDQIGHPPTRQEMQNLTRAEAERFYKVDFWDKVQGDKINSQALANLIADVKSSTGNSKTLQKTLGTPQTGRITDTDIELLNQEIAKNATAFYKKYRAELVRYYSSINRASAHLARLDKDYPEDMKIDTIGFFGRNKIIIFVLLIVLILFTFVYLYVNNKTHPAQFLALAVLIPFVPPL